MNIENIKLHSLSSLKIPERFNLPEIGAVYFVLSENNDIEYIGKAKNLRKRWRAHECCMELDSPKTCRVAWFEVLSEAERTEIEKQLIRKFSPKLNANLIIKTPLKSFSDSVSKSEMKDFLTIIQVADELNLSRRRVQDLITSGRLPAEKVGNLWLVKKGDLEAVRVRKNGRPPKKKEE